MRPYYQMIQLLLVSQLALSASTIQAEGCRNKLQKRCVIWQCAACVLLTVKDEYNVQPSAAHRLVCLSTAGIDSILWRAAHYVMLISHLSAGLHALMTQCVVAS